MAYQHQTLAQGKWQTLSLAEQMGHIGSEISRARKAQGDIPRFLSAIYRAFELIDLTLSDARWRKRLKELARVREVLGDTVLGAKEYGTTIEDLDKYFYYFALAARRDK